MATLNVIYKIGADISNLVQGVERVAKSTEKMEGMFSKVGTRMVALGTAAGNFIGRMAYDAVTKLASGLLEVATNGIRLAPIVTSFERLTASIGETADAMLGSVRTATRGLITDLDIMAASNKAILLGLPVTAQEMGVLGTAAVALGRAMKQDAGKSLDDLITALGRSSPLILDNLGLTVKVGEANELYARQVGKAASELTDAEKKLAFYNAAMDAAKEKVEALGGIQLTLADHVVRAKNSLTNFTDALGVAIARSPVVTAAFGAVADALENAFGGNQVALIQTLIGVVNKVAIGVIDVARFGVTTAEVMGRAWASVKVIFLGVMTVLSTLLTEAAQQLTNILVVSAQLPGVGSKFLVLAEQTQAWTNRTRQGRDEIARMTVEAAKGVVGQDGFGRALAATGVALDGMREKMVAASLSQADAAAIAEDLANRLGDVGEATNELTKEQLAQIRRTWETIAAMERWRVANLFTQTSLDDVGITVKDAVRPEIQALYADVAQLERGLPLITANLDRLGKEFVDTGSAIKKSTGFVDGFMESLDSLWQGMSGGNGISGLLSNIGRGLAEGLGGLLTGGISSLVNLALEGVQRLGRAIGNLFRDEEWEQVNDLRDAFQATFGEGEAGLHAMNVAAQGAGMSLERLLNARTIDEFNAAVDELTESIAFQEDSMRLLEEAASAYGFTVEELGPAWARQRLDDKAQTLFQHWTALHAAGVDHLAILNRMGPAVSEFVQQSVAAGVEIPSAMRPMIEQMIQAGTLLDANGNAIADMEGAGIRFSETMTEGFSRVVQEVQRLTEAIMRGLGIEAPNAAENGAQQIERSFGDLRFRIPVEYDYQNTTPPSPNIFGGAEFDRGTPDLDFASFSSRGTPAVLHNREAVIPEGGGHKLAGEIASALSGQIGGGTTVNVTIQAIDGASVERAAPMLVRAITDALGKKGDPLKKFKRAAEIV